MIWPPDELWSRVAGLWNHVHSPNANAGERANAFTALKQLQVNFDLSDIQLAYIAESENLSPGSRIIKRERKENAFEIVLGVADEVGLVMPFEHFIVDTAWILHTYVFDQFLHTPRLLIWSRGSGYGKSTRLNCIAGLANESRYLIAPSGPALYHQVRKCPRTTLLIDNAEYSQLWNPQDLLRQIYEAGHRQGGEIPRVIRNDVVYFSTFAPLSLGTIITRYRRDKFPQQIASRSIATEMKQRLEGLDNIFPNDPRFVPVRNIASIWAERFQAPKTVSFPKGLVARRADNWRVLIAVADSLGYGATLRAAAIAIERAGFDPEAGLYEAIHQVFEQLQVDRIWVSELMQALREIENSPWASLTTSAFLDMLYQRGIDYRTVWKKGADGARRSNNGFMREQFEPIWQELGLIGHTDTQLSKITYLAAHKRHTGSTQDE